MIYFITMTSKLARWRLKSPASRLFTRQFIRAQIKENIKVPRHWPLCGEFTGDRWIPRQMASNAENVSIWWRHHVSTKNYSESAVKNETECVYALYLLCLCGLVPVRVCVGVVWVFVYVRVSCVSKHWFMQWFIAYPTSTHNLNQSF